MPVITIIMPVYNASEFVEETIQSVLLQNFRDWELLIIDDCSTDNTVDIIKNVIKSDDRCKILYTTKNSGGPAAPRNIGLENASGDFIAFLDADDIWEPNKLTLQIEFIKNNDVDFCSTNTYGFMENESRKVQVRLGVIHHLNRLLFANRKPLIGLFFSNFIWTSSVIIRSSHLKNLRFNESQSIIAVEDYLLWLTVLNTGCKYKYLSVCTFHYRVFEGSISGRSYRWLSHMRQINAIITFLISHRKMNKKYRRIVKLAIIFRLISRA